MTKETSESRRNYELSSSYHRRARVNCPVPQEQTQHLSDHDPILLDRNPVTISRELRRNKSSSKNYHGLFFCTFHGRHCLANERRKSNHRKRIIQSILQEYLKKACETWSPDQIAHRTKDAPCSLPSCSTIYRWIHQ